MHNQNVLIEMWNIHQYRHRTNSAVEGWNSKLKSVIGSQQPDGLLKAQKLKEETDLISWQLKSKEPGEPGQKRRKTTLNERIKNKLWKNTVNQNTGTNV
jgi:hypothetical protein